jgi:hypothetical protein
MDTWVHIHLFWKTKKIRNPNPTKQVDVNPGIHLKPWLNSRDTGDIEQNIQNEEKLNNRYRTKRN